MQGRGEGLDKKVVGRPEEGQGDTEDQGGVQGGVVLGREAGRGGVKQDQEAEQGDTHEVTRDHGPGGQARAQGRQELQRDRQGQRLGGDDAHRGRHGHNVAHHGLQAGDHGKKETEGQERERGRGRGPGRPSGWGRPDVMTTGTHKRAVQ